MTTDPASPSIRSKYRMRATATRPVDATSKTLCQTGPRCIMTYLNLNTVRCEALFASTLQASEDADPERIRTMIMATVRTFGSRGCAARVAQEFGDHPDTAVPRMRWARDVVARVYGVVQIRAYLAALRPPLRSLGRPERADRAARPA